MFLGNYVLFIGLLIREIIAKKWDNVFYYSIFLLIMSTCCYVYIFAIVFYGAGYGERLSHEKHRNEIINK